MATLAAAGGGAYSTIEITAVPADASGAYSTIEITAVPADASGDDAPRQRAPPTDSSGDDGSRQSAPEKVLNRFVCFVAFTEWACNAIGAMAFLWASVILLGGFCSSLQPQDFWFATIFIFVEALRLCSRDFKLDNQLSLFAVIRVVKWIRSFTFILGRPQEGNEVVLIMGLIMGLINRIINNLSRVLYVGLSFELVSRLLVLLAPQLMNRPRWRRRLLQALLIAVPLYCAYSLFMVAQDLIPVPSDQYVYAEAVFELADELAYMLSQITVVLLVVWKPPRLVNLISTHCGRKVVSLAKVFSALFLAYSLVMPKLPFWPHQGLIRYFISDLSFSFTTVVLSLGSLQKQTAEENICLFGRWVDFIMHILFFLHLVLPLPKFSLFFLLGVDPLPTVMCTLLFLAVLAVLVIGNLQILAAVVQVVFSSVNFRALLAYSYYELVGDHVDQLPYESNPNLAPAVAVFYVLALCQGALYLMACILGFFSSSFCRLFAHRSKLFSGQRAAQVVDLYYQRAYAACMENGFLATGSNRFSLTSFAMESLRSTSSGDMQLARLFVLDRLLQDSNSSGKLISTIIRSQNAVSTLISMLGWTSEQDSGIRLFSTRVTAKLADRLIISEVPGILKSVSWFLDAKNQPQAASNEPPSGEGEGNNQRQPQPVPASNQPQAASNEPPSGEGEGNNQRQPQAVPASNQPQAASNEPPSGEGEGNNQRQPQPVPASNQPQAASNEPPSGEGEGNNQRQPLPVPASNQPQAASNEPPSGEGEGNNQRQPQPVLASNQPKPRPASNESSSWVRRCWQRMKEKWSFPEEPPSTYQDSLPVLGMVILEKLACDPDNCVEISMCNNLISKVIGLMSYTTDRQSVDDAQQSEVICSQLNFVRRLAITEDKIGAALRQELQNNPFLLNNLASILEDTRSSPQLWKPAMDIIAKLALDKEAGEEIGGVQLIIGKLMHAFLGAYRAANIDGDQPLPMVAGEALVNLTVWGTSNCSTILEEPGYEVIKDLKDMLSEHEYRYVAANLLQNLCAHSRDKLMIHPDASEHLSSSLTIVMKHIMDAEGKQLESLIGLSSQIGDVIREAFVGVLEAETNNGLELVQKLVNTLKSNRKPNPEYPRMRRVIVETTIIVMESCHCTVERMIAEGVMEELMQALTKIERTPSKVEKYRVFYGNIGVVPEGGPSLPTLVARAKQLIINSAAPTPGVRPGNNA